MEKFLGQTIKPLAADLVCYCVLKAKSSFLSNSVDADKTDRKGLTWGCTVCIYTHIRQYSQYC